MSTCMIESNANAEKARRGGGTPEGERGKVKGERLPSGGEIPGNLPPEERGEGRGLRPRAPEAGRENTARNAGGDGRAANRPGGENTARNAGGEGAEAEGGEGAEAEGGGTGGNLSPFTLPPSPKDRPAPSTMIRPVRETRMVFRGLTQAAKKLRVSRAHLSYVLHGERKPGRRLAAALARMGFKDMWDAGARAVEALALAGCAWAALCHVAG